MPNTRVQATAYSVRSCLAPAARRAWRPAVRHPPDVSREWVRGTLSGSTHGHGIQVWREGEPGHGRKTIRCRGRPWGIRM